MNFVFSVSNVYVWILNTQQLKKTLQNWQNENKSASTFHNSINKSQLTLSQAKPIAKTAFTFPLAIWHHTSFEQLQLHSVYLQFLTSYLQM